MGGDGIGLILVGCGTGLILVGVVTEVPFLFAAVDGVLVVVAEEFELAVFAF